MRTTHPSVDDMQRTISELVTAAMSAAGLSVSDLATRSGIPRATLARKLASGSFRMGELGKVADVLGRRPSDWFRIAEAGAR